MDDEIYPYYNQMDKAAAKIIGANSIIAIGLATSEELNESLDTMSNEQWATWMASRLFCSH
jgi:hypothetical protein